MLLMFVLTICLDAFAGAAESDKALISRAKISEGTARATALAAVGNATVQSAELEDEHGKLVWSYDLQTLSSKDVTEVQVDAMTGKVISVKKESVKEQGKEADEERKERKKN